VYWVGPVLSFIVLWQVWDGVEARRLATEVERVFPGGAVAPPIRRPMRSGDAAAYYAAANVAAFGRAHDAAAAQLFERTRTTLAGGGTLPADDHAALAGIVSNYELPLRLLREASERPYFGDAPFVVEQAYRFTGLHPTAQAAAAETLQLIAGGEVSRAIELLVARTRFLRAYDGDRRAFSVVTKASEMAEIARDASLVLGREPLPAAAYAAFDSALAEAYRDDEIALVVLDEARFAMPFFEGRRVASPRAAMFRLSFVARPLARRTGVAAMRLYADAVDAARRPWPERLLALERLRDPEPPFLNLVPLPWRAAEQVHRLSSVIAGAVAASRALRVALAVERQRGTAPAPAALQDVELIGDPAAYEDPFTGETVRYRRDDAAYVVYSVGRDRVDSGGTLAADAPPTTAPASVLPRDVGVRVVYRRAAAAATNASNNSRNSPVR
jgi:hypothetical protein